MNQLGRLSLLLILLFSLSVQAKRFQNEYTEFELPPGWECVLEGSEWVCQSSNPQRKKEAIIILVAKIRGEQDSIPQYLAYLKKVKTYSLPGGKQQVSEPKYAKTEQINDHEWVDALQLASEVPGFYTRYLATTKEDLGMAITFSVAKDLYNDYSGIFDKVVASLRVFRNKKQGATKFVKRQAEGVFDTSALPDGTGGIGLPSQEGAKVKQRKTTAASGSTIIIVLLVVGGIAFYLIKKRKKKK